MSPDDIDRDAYVQGLLDIVAGYQSLVESMLTSMKARLGPDDGAPAEVTDSDDDEDDSDDDDDDDEDDDDDDDDDDEDEDDDDGN
ncbi:MAG TPA: hypothetical protein VGG74_14780 [Kofleriaceae bacterium]